MLTLKPPSLLTIDYLADNMREEDVSEVLAYAGHSPRDALIHSIQLSHYAQIAYWDGQPVAAFGCATFDYNGTIGSPWLLSTGEFHKFPKEFLKVSTKVIKLWLTHYESLVVEVHSENKLSRKWLEFNGFKVINNCIINDEVFLTMELRA